MLPSKRDGWQEAWKYISSKGVATIAWGGESLHCGLLKRNDRLSMETDQETGHSWSQFYYSTNVLIFTGHAFPTRSKPRLAGTTELALWE